MADDTLDVNISSQEVRMGAPETSIVLVDITNTKTSDVAEVLYLSIPLGFVDQKHVSLIGFGPAALAPSGPLAHPPAGMTRYQLGSARGVAFGKGATITLHLSHITAVAAGSYTMQLQWGPRGGDLKTVDLNISVLGADDAPKIEYFTAKNSVVTLRTSRMPVELSWKTSPKSVVELYRLNTLLLPKSGSRSAPTTQNDYPDTDYGDAGLQPYRLEATEDGKTISRTIFVRVQNSGWNKIACDQGAPMNILSDGGNRLYGIFNSFKGSAIYPLDPSTGSMGTQDQMCPNGAVPDAMEKSPAAFFQNKIFLVGGSQVDASSFSNQVHSYDPKTRKWEDQSEGITWPARMGHAITAYANRLWLTGGVDENGNTLDDVYFTTDGKTWLGAKEVKAQGLPERFMTLPHEMCFHAMQGYSVVAGGQCIEALWVYGGLNTPFGSPYTSMWSTRLTGGWGEMKFFISTSVQSPDPGFGDPFGAAMTTAQNESKEEELRVIATYQPKNADLNSGMYSLQGMNPANLVKNGDNLSKQAVWAIKSSTMSTAQPFRLCAATFGNYIFVQSILSDLATDTLTFHVT
ncbi:kelch repeat-containing protein [Tateyamaria pelophila]|uniref:kelch repeat-containing protein n=1 Tax=Tateyamaria pelophila TaxID=328415 RepID=UPI001CBB832B|nr:kelch repeat-containing protein [Tateyamaria pelophila]